MALYRSPGYQISFESIGLLVQVKKFNTDFQDGGQGGILGFPIRTILATFDLQVNSIFGSGEKVQNRISTWLLGQPSWISDQNKSGCFFCIYATLFPTKFRVNWPFSPGEEGQSRFSRWLPLRPSDF